MIGLRAPWGAVGGVETAVSELSPRLAQLGAEMSVYCRTRYNPLGAVVHQGVQLVNHDTIYTKHLEAIVHTAVAMPAAILNSDIIHIHATGPALMSWLPRLSQRRTVVTIHAFDHERAKWGWWARQALRAGLWTALRVPNRRIVVGRHLQAQIQENTGIQTAHIPNAPAQIDYAPLSEADVDGLQADSYLLYLGRLVPEKNLERCFEAYTQSGIQLPFIVVGDNANMPEYVARLKRIAPKGVRLVGPRYGQAKSALLHHARAFVLPSSIEGFPISVLEAMSVGCLSLLSDIPPHREILSEPNCGRLVQANNWPDSLRWVETSAAQERQMLAAQGKRLVNSIYSWDKAAEKTMAIYQELMQDTA